MGLFKKHLSISGDTLNCGFCGIALNPDTYAVHYVRHHNHSLSATSVYVCARCNKLHLKLYGFCYSDNELIEQLSDSTQKLFAYGVAYSGTPEEPSKSVTTIVATDLEIKTAKHILDTGVRMHTTDKNYDSVKHEANKILQELDNYRTLVNREHIAQKLESKRKECADLEARLKYIDGLGTE